MFQLALVTDLVSSNPHHLLHPIHDVIMQSLKKKYSNKIISGVGLCISIYDLLEIKDPIIHIGQGRPFSTVLFRAIIFHPWPGQVLIGRIRSSSDKGIFVSLGFFDDILIPHVNLQEPSLFDPSEMLWYWNYEGAKLYLESGATIRFKVVSDSFYENPPIQKGTPPFIPITTENLMIMNNLSSVSTQNEPELTEQIQKPSYFIIVLFLIVFDK